MPLQTFSTESFSTFGSLLKYLRRRERLTQLELSIAVGYSETQITRLEKNQRLPDPTTVKALFIPALHIEDEPEIIIRLLELAESARQEDAPAPGLPPYKGLLYFDESDSELFFGREALTLHLSDRVTDLASDASPHFLAVVGASGSGKSSLVRAGLAVTLKRAGWEVNILTPTANPRKVLGAEIALLKKKKFERALLLVDQFEETFTLCHDESERISFIDRLLSLSALTLTPLPPALSGAVAETKRGEGRRGDGHIVVVIALRADFYSHCAQYPQLRHAVAAEQEYIGQMSAMELRRAIEEPAKRGGWEFEAGLVDLLLSDVGAQDTSEPEPGALPLLSHALLATWEHRRGKTFTIKGYRASGGVRSAIAETAESVFTDQLNQTQQALAHDVFLRLTELGEGMEDTRRRAALNELVRQSEDAIQLRTVLNILAEARLITLNEDSAEVAHEALIREWQRLHDWLTQDREGLRLHRHLTESAKEWESRRRDAGDLYRGARLAQAREWVEANSERLNASEYAFLEASIEWEQHDALEREAQRQHELESARKLFEAEKQATGRMRRVSLVLLASLVIAVILAGFAFRLNRLATSRELAAASISNLSVDPELSILLAMEALSKSHTREAEEALHQAVMASRIEILLSTDEEIFSLAHSPDGARLATAGSEGVVKIWNATNGGLLMALDGHTAPIRKVVFSADGKLIATASDDTTVRLWDSASGQLILILKGHMAGVGGVAFSPDGDRLATASEDQTWRIWDVKTGSTLLMGPDRENDRVHMIGIVFSPDGTRIATTSSEGIVEIWDSRSGEQAGFLFNTEPQAIFTLDIHPDGKRLLTTNVSSVRISDLETGEILSTFSGHTNLVFSVAYSQDGRLMASGGLDRKVVVWDVQSGQELITLGGHQGWVNALSFSPDGSHLASSSNDGTTRIWNVGPASEVLSIETRDSFGRIAFSLDGKLIAEGDERYIKVWDVENGDERFSFEMADLTTGVAFDPAFSRLAGATESGDIAIWDLQTGDIESEIKAGDDTIFFLAFSPDGKLLASAGEDGSAKVWDASTGELLREIQRDAPILSVAFSPDNNRLLTTGVDHNAIIWDLNSGEQLVLMSHEDLVWGGVFSPDGNRIATASTDSTARIWDASTGEELFRMTGHTSTVVAVFFSPDGRQLATTGRDGVTKIWDTNSGELLLNLFGDGDGLNGIAISPDGSKVATGGTHGLRLYLLNISNLVSLAKSRVTRSLTLEECRQYLHMEACPAEP